MIPQLFTIIRKDFKMLLRSTSSTLAVLVGPLLVVLLVGLVFTNAGDSELVIGVTAQDFESRDAYVSSLNDAFVVIDYASAEECSDAVRQGAVVSCVSFEAGEPPVARIFIDPSDVNVVYAVIDRVTGQLENQTSLLREGSASSLLDTVTQTALVLDGDINQLREAYATIDQQYKKSSELAGDLQGIRIDVEVVSRADIADAIEVSVNARDDYHDLAERLYDAFEDEVGSNNTEAVAFSDEFDAIEESQEDVNAERVFAELISTVGSLNEEIAASEEQAEALSFTAQQLRQSLFSARSDVDAVLGSIEAVRGDLTGLDVSESDLTRPIEPVLEPVVAEGESFGFVFPYFLTLIVMFTAVLLASTMIVREKNSNAYFRNFTTPTKDWVFVAATYLTTLAVVAVQIVIITVVASFFINLGFLRALPTSVALLWAVASFFILLGMLLGYVFRNHEGVMLAAIAVSSLLLFLSNLVLPVKTLPALAQFLIGANPFVLSGELLKASLVFGFTLADFWVLFLVLVIYSVILFILIMIVQRLARVRYFELSATPGRISRFLGEETMPEEKALQIKGFSVRSKRELLAALRELSDEEYEEHASHRSNAFAEWVLDVYKDERLAAALRNKSRRGAIAVLEKELE